MRERATVRVRGSMGQRSLALLAFASLFGASACNSCGDEHDPARVPFKLHVSKDDAHPSDLQPPSAVEPLTITYNPPIDRPEVDGVKLPAQIVRALLAVDLDADGDRDVVSLVDDPSSQGRLIVSLREPEGFKNPNDVPGFAPTPEATCELDGARFDALSGSKAMLTLNASCGEPKVRKPPSYVLFSLEPRPRVYERIGLLPANSAGEVLSVAPESHDVDGDGHDDVVLSLTLVRASGTSSEPIALAFLDRPNGLVRDVREPEATLSAWASAAEALAKRSPAEAVARAQAVLDVQRALCRESGAPLLSVGGTPGLTCTNRASAASAALVLVLAHAQQGHVRAAFAAERVLTLPELKSDAKLRDQAADALRKLTPTAGIVLREGPAVPTARASRAHLPPVRFVDDGTLFVPKQPPVLYDLKEGTETPAQDSADALVRDPSQRLAVGAIERSCAGYVLRIEHAPPRGSEYVPSPPVSTPLALARESSPGCVVLPEAQRKDEGALEVLGWAPQGVLLARGGDLYVVPLSVEGQPLSSPRMLEPGVPVPAPLPAGRSTPDGSRHVEATRFGVLVHISGDGTELWRPPGYEGIASYVTSAAINPSGSQVAVVSGNRVYLVGKAGP